MSDPRLSVLVQQIRQSARPAPSDRDLLRAYAAEHDQAAFTALVRRHGPMVWHVCSRVLHRPQDAEDAFQATFLVLARKASSAGWRESIGPWLHAVAQRSAAKLRSRLARPSPSARERAAADPLDEMTARELLAVLDEEIAALPEPLRGPVVLCLLEGRTQEEAARLLGTALITLRRRLDAGKKALQAQLTRRGVAPSAALGALAVARLSYPPVPALAAGLLAPAASRYSGLLVLLLVLVVGGIGLAANRFLAAPPPPARSAAAAPAKADPLPAGAVLRLGSPRLRHRGPVGCLAYSPDGRWLASGGRWSAFVAVWDARTGRERVEVRVPKTGVNALAFSPDGKVLAGAGVDGAVYLWDPATGKQRQRWQGHGGEVRALAFSKRGDVLAAGAAFEVRFYDTERGRLPRAFKVEPGWASAVALSPDGRTVTAASSGWPVAGAIRGGTVSLWDRASGKRLHLLSGHSSSVLHIAYSGDGRTLVTMGAERTLTWDVASGKQRGPLGGAGGGRAALSSDGKVFAVGCNDGAVRLWDLASGKLVRKLPGHAESIMALALAPDGKTFASASHASSVIHLRDTSSGAPRLPPSGHTERIGAVAFGPDGRTLATASSDGAVLLWDGRTGQELRVLAAGDAAGTEANRVTLAFTPDGSQVGYTRGDRVLLRNVRTGKEVGRYQGSGFAFSPDGKWLACAEVGKVDGNRGVAVLHDRVTGKKVRELWGHRTPLAWLDFSPDSRTLNSAGLAFWADSAQRETSFLRRWDVATGQERRGLPAQATRMRALFGFSAEATQVQALSPDGRMWASTTRKGDTIKLGEMATGGWRGDLAGHAEMIYAVAFSPNGRLLASGSMDGTVRLWELPAARQAACLEGHRGWVTSVAFSPDGTRLLTGGTDGQALVWDVSRLARRAGTTVEDCWEDLGGTSATAYRAAARLAACPEQAIKLLRGKLRPITAADARRVERLLAELGSEQFTTRERASEELAKLGELVEPTLRKALGGATDLEVKRRLKGLLSVSDRGQLPPETIRQVRAVEVLEHLGGREARRLLETLARGAAEARLTREARESLERLRKRPLRAPAP